MNSLICIFVKFYLTFSGGFPISDVLKELDDLTLTVSLLSERCQLVCLLLTV